MAELRMTDERIEQATKRCSEATPGEWEWREADGHTAVALETSLQDEVIIAWGPDIVSGGPYMEVSEADAEFIAAARTDLEDALADLAVLRDENAKLRAVAEAAERMRRAWLSYEAAMDGKRPYETGMETELVLSEQATDAALRAAGLLTTVVERAK